MRKAIGWGPCIGERAAAALGAKAAGAAGGKRGLAGVAATASSEAPRRAWARAARRWGCCRHTAWGGSGAALQSPFEPHPPLAYALRPSRGCLNPKSVVYQIRTATSKLKHAPRTAPPRFKSHPRPFSFKTTALPSPALHCTHTRLCDHPPRRHGRCTLQQLPQLPTSRPMPLQRGEHAARTVVRSLARRRPAARPAWAWRPAAPNMFSNSHSFHTSSFAPPSISVATSSPAITPGFKPPARLRGSA